MFFYSCDRLRSSAIIFEQSSAIMRLECHDTMTTSCLSTFKRAFVLSRWKVKLTRNSQWKKLENMIVCSIALAKNSLFLKTLCTKKRSFFFDLAAILRLSKYNRSRTLTPIKSSASFAFMLADWSYIVLPLNGKPWSRLSQIAAIGCDHM